MKIGWICLFCILLSNGWSQTADIKGRITELRGEKTEPLPYAAVALMDKDSTVVKGEMTKNDGTFKIGGIPQGDYLLSVSFTGYKTLTVALNNLARSLDVGDLVLEDASVSLANVDVVASNVIQKVDRQIIMPSEQQVKTSFDTYELLNHLAIPRLRVNPVTREMDLSGGGDIQTRINGIKVTQSEVSALRPKDILRVEYIEDPGKRYGDEELGAVVNIVTRRREAGGRITLDTRNSPHIIWGENFFSAQYNEKKSEWALNVRNSNRGFKKRRRDITETYYLGDQTIERIQEGIDDKFKYFLNNFDLSYNLSEPDKYVFNAVFRNSYDKKPYEWLSAKMYEKGSSDYLLARTNNSFDNYSPALDLYFQRTLPHGQSLQVNLVGTLIHSDVGRTYTEAIPEGTEIASILSQVNGKKRSLIGEAIYEKAFRPFQWTIGGRHTQMRTENEYRGSNPTDSRMDQSTTTFFTEIQGKLKNLQYAIGLGGTRTWFKEGEENHTYNLFNPTLRLGYSPFKNAYIRYRFSIDPSIPSLGSLTDVEQAIDTLQLVRGNPKLKTYRIYNNNLNLNYAYNSFQGGVNLRYLYHDQPIMEEIFIEQGKVISRDNNQKSFASFNLEGYLGVNNLTVGSLKNFLSLDMSLGYIRYRSEGNFYSHTQNDFFYNVMGSLTYQNWSFFMQYTLKPNSLFGETVKKGENVTAAALTYTRKNLQIGLSMLFPFTNNYRKGSERLSEVAPSTTWEYDKEVGRMVVIKFAYNFEFGRKYKGGNKKLNNQDRDAGIIPTDR